jgi:hypothetical protein
MSPEHQNTSDVVVCVTDDVLTFQDVSYLLVAPHQSATCSALFSSEHIYSFRRPRFMHPTIGDRAPDTVHETRWLWLPRRSSSGSGLHFCCIFTAPGSRSVHDATHTYRLRTCSNGRPYLQSPPSRPPSTPSGQPTYRRRPSVSPLRQAKLAPGPPSIHYLCSARFTFHLYAAEQAPPRFHLTTHHHRPPCLE